MLCQGTLATALCEHEAAHAHDTAYELVATIATIGIERFMQEAEVYISLALHTQLDTQSGAASCG